MDFRDGVEKTPLLLTCRLSANEYTRIPYIPSIRLILVQTKDLKDPNPLRKARLYCLGRAANQNIFADLIGQKKGFVIQKMVPVVPITPFLQLPNRKS